MHTVFNANWISPGGQLSTSVEINTQQQIDNVAQRVADLVSDDTNSARWRRAIDVYEQVASNEMTVTSGVQLLANLYGL